MMRGLLLWGATGTAVAASVPLENPDSTPFTILVLSIVCLCLSAFFSASETALFSLQPLQIKEVSSSSGNTVAKLLAEPRQTLASILIGNETVNICLSTLTAGLLLQIVPDHPWLNIVIVAPVLLVMGEVLPKTLAFRHNRRIAPRVAPLLLLFSRLVAPIRFALSRIADVFLVITGGTRAPRQAEMREAHLKALIDHGRKSGSIRPVEQEILHNVFAFGEHNVRHLMTPRSEAFTVNLMTPWPDLLQSVLEAGYSRVPVWQGRPDNIVGILVVKKLLTLIARQRSSDGDRHGKHDRYQPSVRQMHKLLHPPKFVPTTKNADDLLAEFQSQRGHLAMVVNEHGHVVGVVTLDDLLNELVGEMNDETAQEDPAVTPIDGHGLRYRIRGNMPVGDFGERFHLPIPEEQHGTVGQLVSELTGDGPSMGEEVEWNGVHFTVTGMKKGQLTELILSVEHVSAEDDPTQESGQGIDPEEVT